MLNRNFLLVCVSLCLLLTVAGFLRPSDSQTQISARPQIVDHHALTTFLSDAMAKQEPGSQAARDYARMIKKVKLKAAQKNPRMENPGALIEAFAQIKTDTQGRGYAPGYRGMGYGRVVDLIGSGIWKSMDRGESWTQLAATANGQLLQAVNRIVVDPNDEDVLVVCSNDGFSHLGPKGGTRQSGIFHSADGGASWTQTFDKVSPSIFPTVQASPANKWVRLFCSATCLAVTALYQLRWW